MHLLYIQQLLVLPEAPGITRTWEMARMWAAEGHQITILCTQASFSDDQQTEDVQTFERDGVTVHALPISYDHLFSFPRRAWSFLQFYFKGLAYGLAKLDKPDAILAYSAPLSVAWMGQRLAGRFGVPWVLEIADVWPDVPIEMGVVPPGPWRSYLRARTRNAYESAVGIVAWSIGARDLLIRQDVPPSKVTVSYNGTMTSHWPEVDRQRPDSRPVEILYAGTVGVANDLTQLLKAAVLLELRNDLPPFRITILGSGNDLLMVKDESKKFQLQRIRFLPRVNREELPHYFAEADIGVVIFAPYPILETNSATKFYDYMAAGLPVVLNYQGWQAQILQDADAGLSTPQGNHGALANNLARLIENQDLRLSMGRSARQFALRHFDREQLSTSMWKDIQRFIDPARP